MSLSTRVLLPTPKHRPELGVRDDTEQEAMDAKGQVIEADGRLGGHGMPFGVLPAYHRRIEEDGLGDGIASEPYNVQEREVRRQTLSGLALDVEDGLRVEADGPCGKVKPATETTRSR